MSYYSATSTNSARGRSDHQHQKFMVPKSEYEDLDNLMLPPAPPISNHQQRQPRNFLSETGFPLPPPPSNDLIEKNPMATIDSSSKNLYYSKNTAVTGNPSRSTNSNLAETLDELTSQLSIGGGYKKNNSQKKPDLDSSLNSRIYANLTGGKIQSQQQQPPPPPFKNYLRFNTSSKQEEEVDHLTDLLVKSMENSVEPDFFGMCNKCGEKVVGEGSGCTAMEMVYHIQCFTCHVCNKELRGKPFYAMETKPYCEECYLNTLEKCSICEKPIVDRILRATGKPYHPKCFACIVCLKSLDGIPFTVDASNQIHCIDCFHSKFAPRCSVCKEPIVPEPGKTETVRVVALDRSFHIECYKCEDCEMALSSDVEGRGCYPLDDHILCKGCNAKRVQAITA